MVVENRNTPKSKAASVWAMMSWKWNDPQLPTSVLTDLHSDYSHPIVIDHDVVADMAPAVTLEKVKEKWAFAWAEERDCEPEEKWGYQRIPQFLGPMPIALRELLILVHLFFKKRVLFDLLMGGIGVALPTPFLDADSANATVANGRFMCWVHWK